jgi:hypothetical protein
MVFGPSVMVVASATRGVHSGCCTLVLRSGSTCGDLVACRTSEQQAGFVNEEPPPDTEHNRSFRTHNGYLAAFRYLAFEGRRYGEHDYQLAKLADRSHNVYADQIKPVKIAVDRKTICGCLYRAWGTETILCTTAALSPDADLLRLALAWGAVQTYYACYAAAQALLVAEGRPRSEQHNTTQNQVVDLWACRGFSLAPWSLAVTEPGGRLACTAGFLNGPDRPLDLSLHPWGHLERGQEWDRAAKALYTTREDRIADAFRQARERKKKERVRAWRQAEETRLTAGRRPRKAPEIALPRLTAAEKESARSRVRAFTMLDYLYRLRIKANYIDDELFSQGPENDSEAETFATRMQDIVAATLLVHELRLGKLLGPRWVLTQADMWLDRNAAISARYGLAARRKLLADA